MPLKVSAPATIMPNNLIQISTFDYPFGRANTDTNVNPLVESVPVIQSSSEECKQQHAVQDGADELTPQLPLTLEVGGRDFVV